MADLKKYRQTRTFRPTWNDVHKDPDPIVITFRVPSRGSLVAFTNAEVAELGKGSVAGEAELKFLRDQVTAVSGLADDDPLAVIHERPGLSREIAMAIIKSTRIGPEAGND